jgi:hypothetical protein
MRKLLALGTILLASLIASAQSASVIAKAHKTTYHIAQATISQAAMCSATAIGPHALLTASHCEQPTDELLIQGVDDPVTIVGKIRDGKDHTIYLLSGITFSDYAIIDQTTKLQQGDGVFIFGNPGDWSDILRKGYFAGMVINKNPFSNTPNEFLFDMQVWHGDSGSAIFSEDGFIVGVVSVMDTQKDESSPPDIQMEGSFAMSFTSAQLQRAYGFIPEASPDKEK